MKDLTLSIIKTLVLSAFLLTGNLQLSSSASGQQLLQGDKADKAALIQGITNRIMRQEERCEDAYKAFDEAHRKMQSGCDAAKAFFKIFEKKGGSSCPELIRSCVECDADCKKRVQEKLALKRDKDDDDEDDENVSPTERRRKARLEKFESELFTCDPTTSDNEKEIRDNKKERKKEIRDAKAKLLELREKQSKSMIDYMESENKTKDSTDQENENFEEAISRFKDKMEREDQVRSQRITKNLATLQELQLKKVEAQAALVEAQTKMELQCHSIAMAAVQKEREELIKKINSSTHSTDFSGVMRQIGGSNKTRLQRKAFEHYKECVDGGVFKKQMDRNQERTQLLAAGIDNNIQQLTQQIQQDQTTERSKANLKNQEELTRLYQQHDRRFKTLNQKRTSQMMNNMNKQRDLTLQMAKLEQEIVDDESENGIDDKISEHRQRLYGAKTSDHVSKAKEGLSAMDTASGSVVSACCLMPKQNHDDKGLNQLAASTHASAGARCDQACTVIVKAGIVNQVCNDRLRSRGQGTTSTTSGGTVQ